MTNVVKCNMCNIVIDEMLCYIQNKVSVVDEESLVRICVSAFTSEEIKKSKSLLFDAVPSDKRNISRKNKGKEERDMADIINQFKSTEPTVLPVFVSQQLDKLPPILMENLDCSKLLKDMLIIKSEIACIKSTYATRDAVEELKTEILGLKHDSLSPTSSFKVNKRRGACLDSGPTGLSHEYHDVPSITEPTKDKKLHDMASSLSKNRKMRVQVNNSPEHELYERQQQLSAVHQHVSVVTGISARGERPLPGSQEVNIRTGLNASSTITSEMSCVPLSPQLVAADKEGDNRTSDCIMTKFTTDECQNSERWQTVTHVKNRRKYRFMGKSGVARDLECTFKAAENRIPMFITNIDTSAKEVDIIKYIENKTQAQVFIEKINMKVDRNHKAYKF